MMKEPEIKLFGRKIVLPENGGECSGEDEEEESDGGVGCDQCSESSGGKSYPEEKHKNKAAENEDKNPDATTEESELDENSNTPSNDDDTASANHPKGETDATNGQQKALKKPDKILPCPRCNSMDTKFCYYNNYNVNQPRHFCRSCQRYWTAGGTMRNVPVGAGRRKNKNSSSHCRHVTISEALQAARFDSPNGFHHMKFKPDGTVLSFGQASPLCESMVPNGMVNHKSLATYKNGEKLDDGSKKNGPSQPTMQNTNGFSSPGPCIPGIPWPVPWNSPVTFPAVYPLPYCPAPYLNYGLPNGWNLPWLTVPPPAANQSMGTVSGSNSPLGKHTRNGELIKPTSNQESSIVVPKTLRIDDPEEAAKSSIWDTLGIKYGSVSREGLFKALQPKGSEKKQMAEASPLLQANPAALSRSISFRETA